MILSTLKQIHGDEFNYGTEKDYKDQVSKIKKSYWKERGELVIQGGCDYSYMPSAESGEEKMKLYALMKLESYGFHKRHCLECLDAFNDNIDDSINLLFDKYFPTRRKDAVVCDLTDETRSEMMDDELESLKSIYDGDEFQEIEKNHIWQFKLRLDYLLKFSPSEEKKSEKQKQLEIDARLQELHQLKMKAKKNKVEKCRNFVEKGNCKFGAKCRFSHDIFAENNGNATGSGQQQRKKVEDPDDALKTWHIEIRFPKWIKYPGAPPIILLRTKISDISKSICLRINQRLIDESRELAKDQIPSVYSIVDLLKNEEEILQYLNKNTFFKYPSAEVSIFDYDPHEIEDREDAEAAQVKLPSHYQLGRVDKFDKRNMSEQEITKENLNLIRKYHDKQKNSYYLKMLDTRKSLPAWPMKEEIVKTINSNQVVVISGDTGCGKSTQVPQFILDHWMSESRNSKNPGRVEIIVTQPRRIAAVGVAERISDERNERIGGVVGYQIRLENKISSSTRLTFCTTGILLRRLYSDPMLENISHLIIDEVHERSEESDFLLLILKEVLRKRPQLKLILMSATLNSKLFSEYFGGAPVLTIQGRTFPVQQIFLEEIIENSGFVLEPDTQYSKKLSKKDEEQLMQELEYADVRATETPPHRSIRDENLKLSELIARYIDYSKRTCKTLFLMDPLKINPELIESVLKYIVDSDDHEWPREGTILVFLPGLAEIQNVYDTLMDSRMFGPRSSNFILIPLHSTLSSDEQGLVFKKMQGKRKIILR
jgi:ATP-dependent RNA helicase DHX57